jgi:Spy/CpxP family protein refolding chaperone
MTRRVYLYFIITICLGAVLGGVGVYYYLWNTGRLVHPGGFNATAAVENLKKVLNLTDGQAEQLRQIFAESAQKNRDLHKQTDPQFQAIHMETRARIREILNPEQQQKFDAFVKAIDERHHRHGPPQQPPPPPPQQ